ncbi:MAG: alpha/beta hydrolase [Lentisphaeraceae bacterium]|nr:alpha/beta hydrolase [Lentisphaeraceae bacterium]
MSGPNVKVFESKNGQISYYDEGEGYPVLFGHSFLWNKDMWRHVIDQLSSSYRCIVPDVFGHGDSSVNENVSLEMLADTFAELMESLGFAKYAVVGLSIGGMWGSLLAQKHSESLTHLAILNSSLTPEPPEKAALYNQLLDMLAATQFMPEPIISQIGPGFFGSGVTEARRQAFYEELKNTSSEKIDSIVSIGRSFVNRADLLTSFSDFKGRVCVIAGSQDNYRSIEESEEICRKLGIDLQKVDAGHISSIEQPVDLAEKLKEFIG